MYIYIYIYIRATVAVRNTHLSYGGVFNPSLTPVVHKCSEDFD